MDEIDRKLLDQIQAAIPLVERPYLSLGKALDLTEADALCRLTALKASGIIRQVSAIFNTSRLGYSSCLVAARVPMEHVEEAAQVINGHPGVSHNYLRGHEWNLWFTLAVPPDSRLGLEATATHLGQRARAEAVRLFPALKLFKIGVRLKMERDSVGDGEEEGNFSYGNGSSHIADFLKPNERRLVQALQKDLPLTLEPFRQAAQQFGLSVEEMLRRGRDLLDRGIMRRFAAVLHHRRAGYVGNVLTVWAVPTERIEAVGAQVARFRAVSHCYQRPAYPDWPYTLFTMLHERDRARCTELVEAIGAETEIDEYAMLWTLREFKKVRLKYFTEEFNSWEDEALATRGEG